MEQTLSIFEASQAVFPLFPIIIGAIILFGIVVIVIILSDSPSPETKKIIILGLQGSGKTTLWRLLKGEHLTKGTYSPTSKDQVESFNVSGSNNRTIKIETTLDLGGGDLYVNHYKELVEAGTFVYFLIDLTTISEKKADINQRLCKLNSLFKDKGIEEKCGLKIIGTHLDETGLTKQQAIEKIAKEIKLKYYNNNVVAMDLFNTVDFQTLKDEIVEAKIYL